MKTTKYYFLMLLTFVFHTSALAQDTYREALQEYYTAWVEPILRNRIQIIASDIDESTTDRLIKDFYEKYDVVDSVFIRIKDTKDKMKEEDLRELTRIFSTLEGKQFSVDFYQFTWGALYHYLENIHLSKSSAFADDKEKDKLWDNLFYTHVYPQIEEYLYVFYKSRSSNENDYDVMKRMIALNHDKRDMCNILSYYAAYKFRTAESMKQALQIVSQPCFKKTKLLQILLESETEKKLEVWEKTILQEQERADFNSLVPLAKQGDADAQLMVGIAYLKGRGVNQDYNIAYAYIASSAEKNQAQALYVLAQFYDNGIVMEKDEEQAFQYYLKAAEQNIPEAMKTVAERYKKGIGTKKDSQSAAYWNKKYKETQK